MPLTVAQDALPDPLAMAARRMPLQRRDGLSPGQYRAVVAAIAAVHVVGIWGLLQVPAVRSSVLEAAPIFVNLLAPPAPPAPAPPPPPPAPMKPVVKAPEPRLITTAPAPQQPAAFEAPPAPELPPPPAPVVVAAPPAPTPPPPAPAPPPQIPASEVRYLVMPKPVYPALSARAKEYGEVMLRVDIDVQGRPAQVSVAKSSGYPRLDEAAVTAMRSARFKPYTVNGAPVASWANASISFEP